MARASATPRSSAYLSALSQEIEKKLQRALASPPQRRNLLQELFADVALEVDDRARDIILSREEDTISPADDSHLGQLCFYDVLADYYVQAPESGKPILDLIVQLWSQSFASHIFSLLFHKWLFEVQLDNPEVLLRYSSALAQGATNVFWIDIQTNTRRFQSLFCYLLDEVAVEPARLNKIPVQAQRDLYLLLSRFILFYNSGDKLDTFLKHCPTFPNAFLIGGPTDFFVTELADQLQKLKVEPVLLHYLSNLKVLQGGTVPSAYHKPVLSAAIPMVLAFLLLELRNVLHKGRVILPAGLRIFKLGEAEKAKENLIVCCIGSLPWDIKLCCISWNRGLISDESGTLLAEVLGVTSRGAKWSHKREPTGHASVLGGLAGPCKGPLQCLTRTPSKSTPIL
ncbi:hypothetical protein CDL15_Pgr024056 [Punica granatum]|uniref:Uncharacterized protein n=1 Tax=Punica granatum TaxID=22663 RepID=A0A218XXS8_PUNGR|nr:hypothetical protein CDL15_Pgr024056 [Punica granatum]